MRKKLSPQSAIHKSIEPQLLCVTSVKPEIVATFYEAPVEFMTRMRLKETLDRSQIGESNKRTRHQNYHRRSIPNIPNEVTNLSDESDLADSPAAESIQSSYQSPIFQELAESNPCPVNGCPLNPSVRISNTF